MFQQLLRAWVISGHDGTGECLMGLLTRMEYENYDPSATEYAFVLRYWTNHFGENEVETVLERMEVMGCKLNVECFSTAILLFSQMCKPWKGEHLLRDMMEQYPKCLWKITWCVVRLIKAYTRKLEFETKYKQEATESVELLSADVLEMCKGDHGLEGETLLAVAIIKLLTYLPARIQGAVIDYYAEAGLCSKAYEVFEKIKRPSIAEYCGLIRAYGRDDKAESAMHVLQQRMPYRPLEAYHAALHAWLYSTKKSTGREVRKVWKQIKHVGFDPRPEDYLLYLEVLSKWKGQSFHVQHILDEMETKGISLTRDCYHYAIQACVIGRDWKRCRSFLFRMSEQEIYPTADTYSDHILPFCDPRRGEEVLPKMRGTIVNADVYHRYEY